MVLSLSSECQKMDMNHPVRQGKGRRVEAVP